MKNERSSKSWRHCRDDARSHPGGLGTLHDGCWPAVRGMVSPGNGRVGSNDIWLLFRCRETPLVTAPRSTCKDSLLSVVQANSPSNLPGPPPYTPLAMCARRRELETAGQCKPVRPPALA